MTCIYTQIKVFLTFCYLNHATLTHELMHEKMKRKLTLKFKYFWGLETGHQCLTLVYYLVQIQKKVRMLDTIFIPYPAFLFFFGIKLTNDAREDSSSKICYC